MQGARRLDVLLLGIQKCVSKANTPRKGSTMYNAAQTRTNFPQSHQQAGSMHKGPRISGLSIALP